MIVGMMLGLLVSILANKVARRPSLPCGDCSEAVLDAAGLDADKPHAIMRTL